MKVSMDSGTYHATFKHRSGKVCLGYGDTLHEAVSNCWHLVAALDKPRGKLSCV